MNTKIKSSRTTKGICYLADIAFKNRLYKDNGLMRKWYLWAPRDINCIVVAFVDNHPVGCAAILHSWQFGFNVGTYVKPEFRRKGIGTKLIRAAVKRTSIQWFTCDKSSDTKFQFYENVGM